MTGKDETPAAQRRGSMAARVSFQSRVRILS